MAVSNPALALSGDGEARPTVGQSMYLASLTLTNFRSCQDTTVTFQPSLTLIVGENNSGKTNIIDGLRLATPPASGRPTRYFEADDDPSFGIPEPIVLTTRFTALSHYQEGQYMAVVDPDDGFVHYTTRFRPDKDLPRYERLERLAGRFPGPDPEPKVRERINHVYLEPLRDAQQALDSARGSRLSHIVRHLIEKDVAEDFRVKANESLRQLHDHDVITKTTTGIRGHVDRLTTPVRPQNVEVGFEDMKLERLTRGLRLKMAEHGLEPADIADSGLGYANLVFMASVILELRHAPDAELTLFLVEEPEAHLHPQLQAVLLDYLKEQTAASIRDDAAEPARRIQVIATTHSPNLASAVGTRNIVALRTKRTPAPLPVPATKRVRTAVAAVPAQRATTVALPLADVDLDDDQRRKIDQYLDVARSELLFTPRVTLVEGIAEAVLLPALAEHCVFLPELREGDTDEEKARKEAAAKADWSRFRASSIINVGSVDFTPYVKLLLWSNSAGVRLVDRLVVITDGDPVLDEIAEDRKARRKKRYPDGEPQAVKEPKPIDRKADLEALATALGARDILHIAEAPYTLEADLLQPDNNQPVLRDAYLTQHPLSWKKWEASIAGDDPARAFYLALYFDDRLISKGEFAHDLATLLERDRRPFTCPGYLDAAIRFV